MTVDRGIVEAVHDQGWAVLPGVLSPAEVAEARGALLQAAAASEAAGVPTRLESLDPGGANVRVYDLVAHDTLFGGLAAHPGVLAHVRGVLGDDVILSNFTANIALPGSGSMNPHNDQSTVMPEPWPEVWAMNAIWCLDDIDAGNGATRYRPGSHRWTSFGDVEGDPREGMESFEAAAGSVVLMHGRLWHTSGENRSGARERALLFAFYTRSFLRPQTNWWQSLTSERRAELDPALRSLLCLDFGNMAHGAYLNG